MSVIGTMPYFTAGPSPMPRSPWHGRQLMAKYFRPFASDASEIGVGFGMLASESIVPGSGLYETMNEGIAVPVVGTDPCGLPRTNNESPRQGSHVTTLG